MPDYVTVTLGKMNKDHVPRFVEALCETFRYGATIEAEQREADEAGQPYTPPTRIDFARAQIRRWAIELERSFRRQKAEEDARNELAQTEDLDVQAEDE